MKTGILSFGAFVVTWAGLAIYFSNLPWKPLRVTLALEGAACLRRVEDLQGFYDAGVRVVSFFITARFAGNSDRGAFVEVVNEQLAGLLGQSVPPYLNAAGQERLYWSLLEQAALPGVHFFPGADG